MNDDHGRYWSDPHAGRCIHARCSGVRDCPRTVPRASPRKNSPARPRSSCSRSTSSCRQRYRRRANCQIALLIVYIQFYKFTDRTARKPRSGSRKNREAVLRWLCAALRHLAKRATLRPQHHARGFVVAPQLLLYRYNHAESQIPAGPRGTRRHARHRHPPPAQPQPYAAGPQGDCRESRSGAEHRAAHCARARCRRSVAGRSADQAIPARCRHAAAGARRARERRLSEPGAAEARSIFRAATA